MKYTYEDIQNELLFVDHNIKVIRRQENYRKNVTSEYEKQQLQYQKKLREAKAFLVLSNDGTKDLCHLEPLYQPYRNIRDHTIRNVRIVKDIIEKYEE